MAWPTAGLGGFLWCSGGCGAAGCLPLQLCRIGQVWVGAGFGFTGLISGLGVVWEGTGGGSAPGELWGHVRWIWAEERRNICRLSLWNICQFVVNNKSVMIKVFKSILLFNLYSSSRSVPCFMDIGDFKDISSIVQARFKGDLRMPQFCTKGTFKMIKSCLV